MNMLKLQNEDIYPYLIIIGDQVEAIWVWIVGLGSDQSVLNYFLLVNYIIIAPKCLRCGSRSPVITYHTNLRRLLCLVERTVSEQG